ncbi:uncharacterized protein EV154DRAFT_494336 [Mucor mucedo]|uniref:SET domain-containing protein n=1 Tax=Mucor saturninus TaxID=64648 RepID=A0A8H7R2L0_9FUNG|nr:uncharacterized protein EV154DRAFT_494336 [Mucor mucedo]KAG2201976.1 hypothetical protein INT47_000515 [Mucor saturninus]KAI7895961.1 hypothetical protein EV154DRAFT_494336 [Mucor mucedo]
MPNTVPEACSDIIIAGKPTHPNDFKVVCQGSPESFSSKLCAERAFSKGSVIAPLEGLTPNAKRYSTVQISETKHIELNSDLVFMNHSCDPSTLMDVDRMVVTATRDIAAGDELTFFYPSTEWDMAQPFSCWCGSSKCIETVQGAQYLSTDTLNQFKLSNHIQNFIKQRDA